MGSNFNTDKSSKSLFRNDLFSIGLSTSRPSDSNEIFSDGMSDFESITQNQSSKLKQLKGPPMKTSIMQINKTRFYPSDCIKNPRAIK